jgi:hypothetical protein
MPYGLIGRVAAEIVRLRSADRDAGGR